MKSQKLARIIGATTAFTMIVFSLKSTPRQLVGILIFIIWIYAAEDQSDNGKPRGWFKATKNAEGYNCYGLLIGFGVILGSAWIASGIFGIIVSQKMDQKCRLVP